MLTAVAVLKCFTKQHKAVIIFCQ